MLYSEYMAWWENSSSVQQNDWAGSSLGQIYLSKKDKKEKKLTWNLTAEYKEHCLKQP